VILDHINHMCSFSLYYTHWPTCFKYYYLSLILYDLGSNLVSMLSHAVMSVVQVFPSFVILSLACVFVRDGLSSVKM
jgi:hypothetical protein